MMAGIKSVKLNSQSFDNYQLRTSADGHYYFNLVSEKNHKVIAGPSYLFNYEGERTAAVQIMIEHCLNANIEDNTKNWWNLSAEACWGDLTVINEKKDGK